MPDATIPSPAGAPAFDLADAGAYAFWHRDVLRWGDTDGLGHINNVVFTRFCESGRIAYTTACGRGLDLDANDFVVVHLSIDFRAEMHFPGEVMGGTRLARLGRSSVRLGHGLFQDGRCAATAESVLVMLDPATRRPRPIPDPLRAALRNPPVLSRPPPAPSAPS